MRLTTLIRHALLLVFLACATAPLAGPSSVSADEISQEARAAVVSGADLERSQKWLDAIEHYEKALKGWPENKALQ